MKSLKVRSLCWRWPYGKNKHGYGVISRDGKCVDAHKFLYEIIKGKTPHGSELDHTCRNRWCVNPEHQEPVSHAENCRRGGNTKLTKENVAEIRRLHASKTQAEIAKIFGVSRASIGLIHQGKRWI